MNELDQYYRILELEPGASLDEVNQAYKDLAFIWHPDRVPEDNLRLRQKAEDKLKEINQARDQLRSKQLNQKSQTTQETRSQSGGYGSSQGG
ncbi:MAG: DnaJ domain-containing protein, partial [Coleofasciculaceae cyanobacterium]